MAIFADTGEEPAAVYKHLDYLRSLDRPPIWVRSAGRPGDDLVKGRNSTGRRFVSTPCLTKSPHGKVGMVRRQCTAGYKIAVVDRAVRYEPLGLKPRERVPGDTTIYQYFGVTADERARADRARRRFEKVKPTVPACPFPDTGWSRKDCTESLRDKLPHPAPKSACVMCPFRTNRSWLHLKRIDHEGWARAVEIDHALRDKTGVCNRGFPATPAARAGKCAPLRVGCRAAPGTHSAARWDARPAGPSERLGAIGGVFPSHFVTTAGGEHRFGSPSRFARRGPP